MARIIIEVLGGVMQTVYSDDPTVEVDLIDWDNKDEESVAHNEKLSQEAEKLSEVPF